LILQGLLALPPKAPAFNFMNLQLLEKELSDKKLSLKRLKIAMLYFKSEKNVDSDIIKSLDLEKLLLLDQLENYQIFYNLLKEENNGKVSKEQKDLVQIF
jgi:hypothetical protein